MKELKIPSKAVFFVDVDRVIVDFPKLLDEWTKRFIKVSNKKTHEAWKNYFDTNKLSWREGFGDMLAAFHQENGTTDEFEATNKALLGYDFSKSYLPGVEATLKRLKKIGPVMIFSQGFEDLQTAKIQPLLNKGIIDKRNLCISRHKAETISDCLARFDEKRSVVAIDDHLAILEAFKECDLDVIGVLVYGNHPEQQELIQNASFPQIVIKELQDIKSFL